MLFLNVMKHSDLKTVTKPTLRLHRRVGFQKEHPAYKILSLEDPWYIRKDPMTKVYGTYDEVENLAPNSFRCEIFYFVIDVAR